MIVRQLKVGRMDNFVYLLGDPDSGKAIVVDSGWEVDPILKAAESDRMKIIYVVPTHHHFDHTQTVPELAAKAGAEVLVHENSPLSGDRRLSDGDEISIGDGSVKVIHTPGHTEDSICVYDGRDLLTGDTLFIGTVGRTDLPGGSPEKLFNSLHDTILKLPREAVIYPGHDYGEVTHRSLGEEARVNPALLAADFGKFLLLFS